MKLVDVLFWARRRECGSQWDRRQASTGTSAD